MQNLLFHGLLDLAEMLHQNKVQTKNTLFGGCFFCFVNLQKRDDLLYKIQERQIIDCLNATKQHLNLYNATLFIDFLVKVM